MTRQKSEDPVVPEGGRKAAPTGPVQGGKGVPVVQGVEQLGLPFATAVNPKGTLTSRGADRSATRPTVRAPKASGKAGPTPHATMETVVEHLDEALDHVARNKGAPGSDGRTIADVCKHWTQIRSRITQRLRNNTYAPGPARRVDIPKPGGGVRTLSIPNVEDRVVQEAMRLTLQPHFEPSFHPSSHGFRPKRSCHTAIVEASEYVADGRTWVVDVDLSKFFDRVHHQRLLARVARKVDDRVLMRTLSRIIRSTAVLPNGLLTRSEEGVPQGGPLSPLLSNIALDELDWELDRRGHRFVRYADDIAVFVRSSRAGERVMQSLTRFIESRLRLAVNATKSAVHRSSGGNLLGFTLRRTSTGEVKVQLSRRSKERLRAKIGELTPRNWGSRLRWCIARLNRYLDGWFIYFGVATPTARSVLREIDAHMRRRLRAIQLKQWKRKRTIVRKLNRIKHTRSVARSVYADRKGWWVLSNLGVVTNRLGHRWFAEQGLITLVERRQSRMLAMAAPAQQSFGWG